MSKIGFGQAFTATVLVFISIAVAVHAAQGHEDMVLVPGGTRQLGIDRSEVVHFQQVFQIRNSQLFENEIPKHTVTIETFNVDRELVTNARFKEFVDHNPPWSKDQIAATLHNAI